MLMNLDRLNDFKSDASDEIFSVSYDVESLFPKNLKMMPLKN